jgi:hypothetical protein
MDEMIKTGDIRSGVTPDTEQKLPREKTADTEAARRELDDDINKRLADRAANGSSKKPR